MPGTFSQYTRHTRSSLSLTQLGRYDEVRNQTLRLAEMPTINGRTIQSTPDVGAFILTAFYAFSSHASRCRGISPRIRFTDVGAGT
jgi:hypothetical protein